MFNAGMWYVNNKEWEQKRELQMKSEEKNDCNSVTSSSYNEA